SALAHTLLSLLRDKPRRDELGRRARLRAEEFSWERVAKQVLDHYVTLLNGRTGAPPSIGGS
ncbi:MAG: glycosyltransferase family 1 protein, partial [Chloroflexota bacterium]